MYVIQVMYFIECNGAAGYSWCFASHTSCTKYVNLAVDENYCR